MPRTTIVGGGLTQAGPELQVDPQFSAARVAFRPLDYTNLGQILGHYRVAVTTGTTVSVAGAGILAYLRWTAPSFFVLMRVSTIQVIAATITSAVVVDAGLYVARGSTAAGSGGNAVVMGTSQKTRMTMGNSLVTDFRYASTAALTAPTGAVVDTNSYGMIVTPLSGQTATTTAPGPMMDLYKWDALGQHPIVLSNGELVEIQEITAGPTTGGIKWYFTFEWAEVALF